MTKPSFALRLLLAGLCGLVSITLHAQNPQQLVFAGRRATASPTSNPAQFNAVKSDAAGNLYLLLDQKDGIRLLKTDPTAANLLAQTQLGAHGDIGLSMALDPSGYIYITGTTTSGSLATTSGVAFPTPADTSTNSFIAKFDANLNTLFVTYTGSGRTAATSIAATGDTTSSGYPTLAALIPEILSTTSGFLTKLTPAGDGILFSTFIPGPGPTSLALDTTTQNLLLSGTVDLGQFPIANAPTPLVNTTYQTLLRLSLDGSTVLASTLLAPGTQSFATPAPNGAAWITGLLSTPLLPTQTLSSIGNAFALRVTAQNIIDQAARFGALP